MNDIQFTLIMTIIAAAKDGRYMHGNGRYFFVMENNVPTCIDLFNNSKMIQADYVGTPMVCTATVNSLTSYLMLQDSEFSTRDYNHDQAHGLVKEAVNDNRLLYTNGGQWTILHTDQKTVITVDLSVNNVATISSGNQHSSWKYMQNNGSYRATISPETKKFMRF